MNFVIVIDAVIAATLLPLSDCFKDEKAAYVIIEDSQPVPKDCATPIIIYKGDPLQTSCRFDLHAEGELLCHPLDIMQAYSLCVSSYFTFNISYNKQCKSQMTFLQKHVLKLQDKVTVLCGVRALMNKTSAEEILFYKVEILLN